jgi:hypothetical protein
VSATTAQSVNAAKNGGTAKASRAVGAGGGPFANGQRPFLGTDLDRVPAWVTRRSFSVPTLGRGIHGKTTRAPGDIGVVRQTLLMSRADPTQGFSITPAPCQNEHPFWAPSGTYIVFDSNRNSATDTTISPTGLFSIFSMGIDGTGVTQLLPPTAGQAQVNQIEPVVSNQTLAFVAGGTISFSTGLTTPSTAGFNLYTLDLSNVAAGATQVTDLQNSPVNFSDVIRPALSPGSDAVIFAGKLVGQNVYHLWKYTFGTAHYDQLTSGPSNDVNPCYSPDGNSIAFTSNASGFVKAGVSTGVFADGHFDIYTTSSNPLLAAVPTRITNFAAGGVSSSNRDPAWGSQGIAFASTRVDSKNNGIPDSVGATTDIYILAYPVPESKGNPAMKLQTSEPDTSIDPNDPTFNFDPNHTSNEDFPSLPPTTLSVAVLPRIQFESDRITPPGQTTIPNELELYAAAQYDINAPTLLKFDQGTNDIVNVQLETGAASAAANQARQYGPGQTVRIAVRMADYQTGVKAVYVQIKCPNAQEKSLDGIEHKIFYAAFGALGGKNAEINEPFEWDYQAVDAQPGGTAKGARFKAPGSNATVLPILPTWPGGNLYLPGYDDVLPWSGSLSPPDVNSTTNPPVDGNHGCWLQLYDDGPASGGGHEPAGETAGDGIYTGTFTTPTNLPSDWVIDVIAYDNAVNPNPNPSQNNKASNWIIYDNVWGFSTQPFAVTSQCLYVDDYDTGQKFTYNRVGSAFPGFNITAIPTESWMTELDPALFPTVYTNGTQEGALLNYATTLGAYSYLGDCHPINQNYDIWRIQCRGAVPQAVLNQYLPHIENEPIPNAQGVPTLTPVTVAESCVIWHSPYTGDLFVGPGTILDPSTQSMLSSFVAAGGRLFTTGQDMAWGLTLGGTLQNQFLSNTMHVNYVANTWFNPYGVLVGGWNSVALSGAGRGAAPIAWETWYGAVGCWHDDFLPLQMAVPEDLPPGQEGPIILFDTSPTNPYTAAASNQGTPNAIAFPVNAAVTAPTPDVLGIDATSSGNTPVICWYSDPKVNSRIVYSAIGFEGINPDGKAQGAGMPPPFILSNKRMELVHNILDYLRTGRIVGTAFAVNGTGGTNQPLGGALITAQDTHNNNIVAAATAAADGTFSLDGLVPDGIYLVSAIKPGYVTQHTRIDGFHGSSYEQVDFYTTLAPPGTITGKITVAGSNTPQGGAIVAATDVSNPTNTNPPVFTGTSDPATGIYTITVPNSTYTLTVTNVTQLGFVASIPASRPGVVVAPSQVVSGQDFALQQKPGRILGKVDIADATGKDTGTPLAGAVVTASTTISGAPVTYSSAPTGSDGTYVLPNLPPGTYGVVAARSGYQTSASVSVTVLTQQDSTNINFALVPIPPGSISGLVQTSTGIPVSGAEIDVVDSTGNPLPKVFSGAPQTVGSYTFNYVVSNVPAGASVTVTATKPGYTPKPNPDTQTVPITTGVESKGINFILDPLYVFDNGLALVSSPYYYTVDNTPTGAPLLITTLLGIPQADVSDNAFAFITWNAATQTYVYYPTPPADTFHLGVGYFMQDTDAALTLALTNPNGLTAPQDSSGNYKPYSIPLQTGWNMIGMPFTTSVDFTSLQVLDGTNLVNVPVAQSGTNPSLGGALWTYANGNYQVVYTLDPFRGYWLRAFRPVTLIVSPTASTGRGAGVLATRALEFSNNTHSDWKLDLVADAGGLTKSKATLGMHRAATDGYDVYKMEAAPPVGKQSVNLTFDHSDWNQKSGSYAVDVRSASANSWDFIVRSNVPNAPVTLHWPSIAQAGRHTLMLTDLDGQTSFELHNRSSYTIPASGAQLTRHFRLQVSGATRPNLQITDLRANMVGGRATGGLAGITYTLTDQASVEVMVLQNGRRVRTLTSGDTRAAGATTVTWDLKNDQGVAMPTNVYTIEVRAVGSDGHVAHQERPLVVTR